MKDLICSACGQSITPNHVCLGVLSKAVPFQHYANDIRNQTLDEVINEFIRLRGMNAIQLTHPADLAENERLYDYFIDKVRGMKK